MKNDPEWLKEVTAVHGARVNAGTETVAEADAAVTAAIMTHPEYVAERMAVLARQQVSTWTKSHATSGDLFQAMLFDGVPAFMQVRVGHAMQVIDMTGDDLDHARNMIETRTQNVRAGADRDWAAFSSFYERVRPHLDGDRTVADALAEIAAEAAA